MTSCLVKFKTNTGTQVVNMDWVRYAEPTGNETYLHVGDDVIEVKHTLQEVYEMWEKALKERLVSLKQQEYEVII